jgi:hypothetical protein
MKAAEIPQSTLQEAYQAIAERHRAETSALDRSSIPEPELLSAVAYVLGIPLLEADDLDELLLRESRILSADLEVEPLADYQFVPLSKRADILVAVSSCPWDMVVTEVLLGYFRSCSAVKFVLTSPGCLKVLLNKLKPAPLTPATSQPEPEPIPVVLPPGAQAAARAASQVAISSSLRQPERDSKLTTDEVTQLMNLLSDEMRRIIERKSRASL